MILLQSYGERIRALGGDSEVLAHSVDQGGDEDGITLGFVVKQIKFIPL